MNGKIHQMQYVLHKSWVDYTFSTHYAFFTGSQEETLAKQQEYTAIFQKVLKELVCVQVLASIQFYTQLIQAHPHSKMSEDVLTTLSIFQLTYQEELAKLTLLPLSDNEKQYQAVISAYIFCFANNHQQYTPHYQYNEYLTAFENFNTNQICQHIPFQITKPIHADDSCFIDPISIEYLIPQFTQDYPFYWNELTYLREDMPKPHHIQNEYTKTIKGHMQQLEQEYGSDHPLFHYAFWETDANQFTMQMNFVIK